jgi:hypothetical protein
VLDGEGSGIDTPSECQLRPVSVCQVSLSFWRAGVWCCVGVLRPLHSPVCEPHSRQAATRLIGPLVYLHTSPMQPMVVTTQQVLLSRAAQATALRVGCAVGRANMLLLVYVCGRGADATAFVC